MSPRFIFLSLILSTTVYAQTDSTFLRGNWLKTDGSNTLHLAVFGNAACYDNKTWKIRSLDQSKLVLENASQVVTLALKKNDDKSIELGSGRERVTLKKRRTFSSKFKPTKEKLQDPYVRPGEVTISGIISSQKLRTTSYESRYVTVSYLNELTNDEELAFGDIDDDGRFELKLMLYRPQTFDVRFNYEKIGNIFAQPGSSMVLAINTQVEITRENPDYDDVAQRIGFMGDNATFNNLHQHFLYYSWTVQFPDLKFSKSVHAGKSVPEKKAMIFEWHKIKEDQLMAEMDYVYPKKTTEARFIEYIRDEIRYVVAESLVSNFKDDWSQPSSSLKIDSTDMAKIRWMYLANLTPQAMNHESFYKFARQYVSYRTELKTHGSMRYSIDQKKMHDRVKNEYAALLPATFIKSYEKIMSEIGTVNFQMNETQLMERYFNGSKEQMDYFEIMFQHIRDQMAREVKDTIEYENHSELFPDPLVRYVANLRTLDDNDSEYGTPSIYRLALYKRYSKGGAGPWRMVDTIRRENAMFTGLAGIGAKLNSRSLDDIQDETQWQELLSRYKGKTVVCWLFSGRYTTVGAYSAMHEIKKVRKQFEGKNVVFLKIILERTSDAQEHLMSYIQAFARSEEFNDIYRIRSNVSLNGLRSELINGQVIVYGDNGLVHHPEYFFYRYDDPRRGTLSLVKELDDVLNAKGKYNEKYANDIFQMPFSRSSYGLETFRWTHAYTSGRYHTYQYKEPKERDYRYPNDSILHQLTFLKDTVIEQSLYLKRVKHEYKKVHTLLGKFAYSYDPEKYILTIMDRSAIRKKYRVTLITNELMLLELLD